MRQSGTEQSLLQAGAQLLGSRIEGSFAERGRVRPISGTQPTGAEPPSGARRALEAMLKEPSPSNLPLSL